MSEETKPTLLERALGDRVRHAERVRLGVGVTGRTATIGVVAMIGLGAAAVAMHDDLYRLVAIGAILVVALVCMVGTWWFASKHPEAALLEGAEFLRYREAELAAKGLAHLPAEEPTPNPQIEAPPAKEAEHEP